MMLGGEHQRGCCSPPTTAGRSRARARRCNGSTVASAAGRMEGGHLVAADEGGADFADEQGADARRP